MGPAYLEFSIDFLNQQVEESDAQLPKVLRAPNGSQGDPALVKEAVDLLLSAKKPTVRFGAGVWWAQAAE